MDNVSMGSAQLLGDPRGFGLPGKKCGAGRGAVQGKHVLVRAWRGGGM